MWIRLYHNNATRLKHCIFINRKAIQTQTLTGNIDAGQDFKWNGPNSIYEVFSRTHRPFSKTGSTWVQRSDFRQF